MNIKREFYGVCDGIIKAYSKDNPNIQFIDRDKLFEYIQTSKITRDKWEKHLINEIINNTIKWQNEKTLKNYQRFMNSRIKHHEVKGNSNSKPLELIKEEQY